MNFGAETTERTKLKRFHYTVSIMDFYLTNRHATTCMQKFVNDFYRNPTEIRFSYLLHD